MVGDWSVGHAPRTVEGKDMTNLLENMFLIWMASLYWNWKLTLPPKVTLVVTPSPRWSTVPEDARSWQELVTPIIQRCVVGAKIGDGASWNREGYDAMGYLIGEMARRLDTHLDKQRAKERA